MMSGYSDTRIGTTERTVKAPLPYFTPQTLLILLAFCEKNIVRYAILVFSMIPGIGFLSAYILPVLYIALILLCINGRVKMGLSELAVPLFVVMAIFLTCTIYPQNAQYIFEPNNFWNTIFPCLRWFIVGLVIIPDKFIMDLLGKVCCLAIVVEVVFLLFYMIPNNLIVLDDMNRAYQLLPQIMLAFNYAFNSKKIIAWFFSGVGLLYLLSLGTRGPFVVLLAYILIKLIRNSVATTNKKILLVLGSGFVAVILSIQEIHDGIWGIIDQFFKKIGLSTRIIEHMVEGTIVSYTSGRDDLFEFALKKISERPFLGYGVYGEWQWFEWNAHNMYLELLLHFGVILGCILIVWGIRLVAGAYFKTNNKYTKDMILIFSCFVFLRGFFSGSYLMFGVFFLIGLCIKEKRRIRKQAKS